MALRSVRQRRPVPRSGAERGAGKLTSWLRWRGSIGEFEEALREWQRRGVQIDALDEEPELFADLRPILSAFEELDHARQFVATPAGPVPQRITFEAIAAWCELNGVLDADERRYFARLIRAADRVRFEKQETTQEQ